MMTWHWLLERGHHIHLCVISHWFLNCHEPISILTTPMINAPPQSPESPDSYHGYFSAHVFLDLHVALCILGLLESVSLFWEHAVSPASSSLFSLPHLCALHLLAPRASVVPCSSSHSIPVSVTGALLFAFSVTCVPGMPKSESTLESFFWAPAYNMSLLVFSLLKLEHLTMGQFSVQRTCSYVQRHFWLLQLVAWSWQRVTKHPTVHEIDPNCKKHLAPYVNNTKVEKPCNKDLGCIMPQTEPALECLLLRRTVVFCGYMSVPPTGIQACDPQLYTSFHL